MTPIIAFTGRHIPARELVSLDDGEPRQRPGFSTKHDPSRANRSGP